MECIIHYNDVNESDVKNFTDTNFNALKKCAQQWLSLEGVEKFIALKHRGGVLEDVLGLEDVLEDTF